MLFVTRGLTKRTQSRPSPSRVKIHGDDNALIECRDPMESDLRRWLSIFFFFFFFLARNTPLYAA